MSLFKEFPSRNGFFQGYLRYISDNNKIESELNFTQSGQGHEDRNPENVLIKDSVWTSNWDMNYGQWIQIELKNTILDISAYGIGYGGNNYPRTFDFSISYDGLNWKTVHIQNLMICMELKEKFTKLNALMQDFLNGQTEESPELFILKH